MENLGSGWCAAPRTRCCSSRVIISELCQKGVASYRQSVRNSSTEGIAARKAVDMDSVQSTIDEQRVQTVFATDYLVWRERDSSEAERAQHIKQIHDLKGIFKKRSVSSSNCRNSEDSIQRDIKKRNFKEVEVVQQAELRERAEQYNQLWLAYQRQFGEMERLHMHIQQLQLELTEARGGTYSDGSQASNVNSKDASHLGQSNGSQLNADGSSTPGESSIEILCKGPVSVFVIHDLTRLEVILFSEEHLIPSVPLLYGAMGTLDLCIFCVNFHPRTAKELERSDHVHGMPVAPSSLLGITTYLPPGQIATLHPYVMHQQGIPPPLPSHVPQSHVGHFPQYQQYRLFNIGQTNRSDSQYDHETTVNGHTLRSDYGDVNVNQGIETQNPVVRLQLKSVQTQQTLHQISSQFNGALRLDSNEHNNGTEVNSVNSSANYMLESQGLRMGEFSSNADKSSVEVPNNVIQQSQWSGAVLTETYVAGGQKNAYAVGKSLEVNLLDEKALLACIVRTIPPGSGGRIRISSTLPNRLGKMLAPLHWHDYKKKYGKLDEFVENHPEPQLQLLKWQLQLQCLRHTPLFCLLCSHYATKSPFEEVPSVEPTSEKAVFKDYAVVRPANSSDNLQNQISNGASFNIPGGISNVKILTKPRDQMELNASGVWAASSVQLTLGNGANADKNDMGISQNKVSSHGRHGANVVMSRQNAGFHQALEDRQMWKLTSMAGHILDADGCGWTYIGC
ncbi:hypothetical protein HAX54_016027 [Datura stramonium]|uniref:DUF7725 domain-containing protein n=1 Tax=Datura stramonium TaxID=4076 RepID=A0ABS8S1N2_DATST|nr:hypothetical protein [Datura stramonium]